MAINIKKGDKVFRKAFYRDFMVYDLTFYTKDGLKSASVYISSFYKAKGFVAVTQIKNHDTYTYPVTFEREMSEKEILKYVKYISGITG